MRGLICGMSKLKGVVVQHVKTQMPCTVNCRYTTNILSNAVMLKSLRPLPKTWIFTSLEDCLICFVTLLFTLEEHCSITVASITTFRSELFDDLIVLEAKMFKLLQVLLLKIWAKKGVFSVDRSKSVILHEEGYTKR